MTEASPKSKPASGASASKSLAIVGSALVAMIVVLVNYISFRRYERWDLTRDQLFTLSPRTEEVLKELPKPVDLYLFMSSGEPNFQEIKELLTRYQSKTDKLTVHTVDPDREPAKFRLLAEKFGVRVALHEGGQTEAELAVLAVSGDKRWSITRPDLVELDYDSLEGQGQTPKVNVKTEQALTGALVQVTTGRPTKVCVTDGHGEWTLDNGGERNLTSIREVLKRENIVLESLATRGKDSFPKDCDAVFVLGPQKAFTDAESAAFKSYLEAGGNLLLMLDPVISGEQILPTGLEGLTSAFGVTLDQDVLVELDAARLLSPSPVEHFLVLGFGDHETVRPLVALGAPVVMQLARTLSVAPGSDAQVLLKASEKAYGESTLTQLTAGDDLKPGEGDVQAPVTLAAAVDTRPEEPGSGKPKRLGGRMIVIGDSDWLAPQFIDQAEVANVDLLSSFTGWLTEREALVAIAPRKINAQSVVMTEDGLFGVFLRVVLLMPLSALVLGLGVWWQRRQ
ncbi:MAG: GldG family protein [Myxococcales bacterium]